MKTIIDPNYPVHFVNAWTKNLALCGSGWLQATGSEDLVTCPNCQRLLTQRALDVAVCTCEKPLDDDGWRCIACGLLLPRNASNANTVGRTRSTRKVVMLLSDFTKNRYWKEYVESLDGLPDDGVFGLLDYVSRKLEAAQQSVQADGALCADCGKSPAMEGCTVCAECGL